MNDDSVKALFSKEMREKLVHIGQNGHGIGCGRKNVISQKTNEEFVRQS